jgi:hypothetical protein
LTSEGIGAAGGFLATRDRLVRLTDVGFRERLPRFIDQILPGQHGECLEKHP